jgi:peptidoglycan/LPS O-acetylase OafA/YrhL
MRFIIGRIVGNLIRDPETPRGARILLIVMVAALPVAIVGLWLWGAWYTGSKEMLATGIIVGAAFVILLAGLREPLPGDTVPPPEDPEQPHD